MSDTLFDLAGRVAVVTGGLGQLGAAYAAGLAARGMKVAVFDIETEPAPGRPGLASEAMLESCEVTAANSIKQATDELVAAWGVPHLLVNNAGASTAPRPRIARRPRWGASRGGCRKMADSTG